jgi:hypothetical protein
MADLPGAVFSLHSSTRAGPGRAAPREKIGQRDVEILEIGRVEKDDLSANRVSRRRRRDDQVGVGDDAKILKRRQRTRRP